ncbi:MAG: L-seryl-tRNA(Sec) selenium transferase [Gemmatimonadota bacterium]|nr:L-seryl-tRNA(Sec) selenium transferase [Gemmatimonadota bacterium]
MTDPRRLIPSVDTLLDDPSFGALLSSYPRPRVVKALRSVLDAVRREAGEGMGAAEIQDPARYAGAVSGWLARDDVPSLRRVVNATGVVLHTNLGRAPLAEAARRAMHDVAGGYSNLEFDLDRGERGSRYDHCVDLLTELTGAEDALVVNNAAAALVLALNTMAQGRGVVVSRGELVEIGGGFRIPEIMERSGARLVEVGSTNRTRADDFALAVEEHHPGALLKVHRSNFRLVGFTEETTLAELVSLGRDHGLPVLYDLGSGLLADPAALGLPAEPRPREALEAGADVVVFSGDKLLGGPQAGVVVGRSEWVGRMRRNPLCRALRVDKVTLAGLEATLRLYRDPERALAEIPVLRMLSADPDELRRRCEVVAGALRPTPGLTVEVVPGTGAVGGGTYPEVELPGWVVRLAGGGLRPAELIERLRSADPPVVGRVEDDAVLLDPRTVHPDEEEALLRALAHALGVGVVDLDGEPE